MYAKGKGGTLQAVSFSASLGQPAGLTEWESEKVVRESGKNSINTKLSPSRPASLLLLVLFCTSCSLHLTYPNFAPVKGTVNHYTGRLLVLPVHCGGT